MAWSCDQSHPDGKKATEDQITEGVMWIFSRWGFYSIACANKPGSPEIDPDTVMVRARVRRHLVNLQKRFPVLAGAKILALPGRDYDYRIIVPKATWVQVLTGLAEEQTWSNFKNEATAHQAETSAQYIQKLHSVWADMLELQNRASRY